MAKYFVLAESYLKTLTNTEARLCKVGEVVEVRDNLEPGIALIPVDAAALSAKNAVKSRRAFQKIDTSAKERRLRAKLDAGTARRLATLEDNLERT